ncbi:Uma2 family endonuclease [Jidongwangia harbinensis]|uniref:Uma2 family endonuclease n=1 Tax=Jidongwangia harbinensis TaxID=2878561 RepID=UPI001CDA29A1|nr:Uma2 family endonuclease [Jidongwangia harbinensis]MCA2216744.1 Uma2 family endonuclease [Jidongwangia harbinensis]
METGHGSLVRWAAPDGPWTEPDLHLFPQDGHRYEIVDGALHVTPPLDRDHESVARALVTTLRGAAPAGWWVCARLGVEIGASNLIPDVIVLRPESSGAIWTDPADVALVIEVESTESRRYDRLLKPTLYAEAGIPSFWRVEPGPALHVYRLEDGGYRPERTVQGAELVQLDAPYPVRVAPSTWV